MTAHSKESTEGDKEIGRRQAFDLVKKQIEAVKQEINSLRDKAAQDRFTSDVEELETLYEIAPPNSFFRVVLEIFIGPRLAKIQENIRQYPQQSDQALQGIGASQERLNFIQAILGHPKMVGLSPQEKDHYQQGWAKLLDRKEIGQGELFEERIQQALAQSQERPQVKETVFDLEITEDELTQAGQELEALEGKKINEAYLKGGLKAVRGLLNLELAEPRRVVADILANRSQKLPAESFLMRLRNINEGLVDDPQTERELLANDVNLIRAYTGHELSEQLWRLIMKANERLKQIQKQQAERNIQLTAGIPSAAELSGDPEALQRAAERRRILDQQRLANGYGLEQGNHDEIQFSSLYLSGTDREEIKLNPEIYFRRLISQFHKPTADRQTLQVRMTEAKRYFDDLVKAAKKGKYYGRFFKGFEGLTKEDQEMILKHIEDLYNAYFHGSIAYNNASTEQNIEHRTQSKAYFGPDRIGFFDANWGFNLFKSLMEQEDVMKAFLRLGDRLTDWLPNSLENMRTYLNQWLKYLIENPGKQNDKTLKDLFCMKDPENPLSDDQRSEVRRLTGYDLEDKENFGIFKDETKLFYDMYDWMGRIAVFDGNYQDQDFWMPYNEENKYKGSPPMFMEEPSKLLFIYGALFRKKDVDKKAFLERLREVVGKDKKGELKVKYQGSEEEIKKTLLEEIRNTPDGQKKEPDGSSTPLSEDEIWRKALHQYTHGWQFNEFFRRAGMASQLRRVFAMRNQAEREVQAFPGLAEVFDGHNLSRDWQSFFWNKKLEEEMQKIYGKEREQYIKGLALNFYGKGMEGIFTDQDKLQIRFPDFKPNDQEQLTNLANTASLLAIPGRDYAKRKFMNSEDWHNNNEGVWAANKPLQELMSNPFKAAFTDGKIEEIFQALAGYVYFDQENPEKPTSLLDPLFRWLTGQDLAPTVRHQMRLDMYKDVFRNSKCSYEIKRSIYYLYRRQTFPDVEATANPLKRLHARFKNWVQFERELLYVLGPQHIIMSGFFGKGWRLFIALLLSFIKEVITGTDMEKMGIDPTKL